YSTVERAPSDHASGASTLTRSLTRPPHRSAECVVRRKSGEIDEVRHRGSHVDDLHGVRQAEQQRADDRSTAALRQQLWRDVGAVQCGHDEDIGRPGESTEWVEPPHQLLVESDIGAHLAVIFETYSSLIEQGDGGAHAVYIVAHRIAEIRVRQERHPRLQP